MLSIRIPQRQISMALQSPTHSPPSDKWIIKESSWNIMAWAAVIFWAGYMLAARLSKDLVMILFGISMCNFNICHQETDQKNHCQHIVLRTAGQQYSFPGSTASHRECRVDPQCGIALLNLKKYAWTCSTWCKMCTFWSTGGYIGYNNTLQIIHVWCYIPLVSFGLLTKHKQTYMHGLWRPSIMACFVS